jgi:hypothetical protein
MYSQISNISVPTKKDLVDAGIPSISNIANNLGVSQNKPVIVAHKVKIFDMSNDKEAKEYCKTMKKLMSLVQEGKCALWANEKQFTTNNSGESTWKKYLEWTEYDLVKHND